MGIRIIYPQEKYFKGFYHALTEVAKERIYLEMIEPPPFEKVVGFQTELLSRNGSVYYAVDDEMVVGWCDIFPKDNPRQDHRGTLGMGILSSHRHQGIGSQLMKAVLDHAKKIGLEKVELYVYTSNASAIALYKKHGFIQEGLIKNYRKLDGIYFDSLMMAKML